MYVCEAGSRDHPSQKGVGKERAVPGRGRHRTSGCEQHMDLACPAPSLESSDLSGLVECNQLAVEGDSSFYSKL